MNQLDVDYQQLLVDILTNGTEKEDRTGTGTISVFGRQIRHNMKDGFPLLTTKKMAIKSMMTELKWFLKGNTNIRYLVDNGCNIWNGDAYKRYHTYAMDNSYGVDVFSMEEFIDEIKTNDEFALKWGELGPIYGAQWKDWYAGGHQEYIEDTLVKMEYNSIDQIAELIKDLKNNPDSRRLMVNAWNVGEIDQMVLPPCHYGFQVYTRELSVEERGNILKNQQPTWDHEDEEMLDMLSIPKRAISLMWNQRSVDTPLGLPFNIASYATLLMLLAEEVNMVPDELVGNLGDTHIYKNQVEGVNIQLGRQSFDLPQLKLSNVDLMKGEFDYEVVDYKHHPVIKFPLSN
jgi:thymidylate synthase